MKLKWIVLLINIALICYLTQEFVIVGHFNNRTIFAFLSIQLMLLLTALFFFRENKLSLLKWVLFLANVGVGTIMLGQGIAEFYSKKETFPLFFTGIVAVLNACFLVRQGSKLVYRIYFGGLISAIAMIILQIFSEGLPNAKYHDAYLLPFIWSMTLSTILAVLILAFGEKTKVIFRRPFLSALVLPFIVLFCVALSITIEKEVRSGYFEGGIFQNCDHVLSDVVVCRLKYPHEFLFGTEKKANAPIRGIFFPPF